MASTSRNRFVANAAGKPKKKLTDKQIKFFGTSRQRANLARRKAEKRAMSHKPATKKASGKPRSAGVRSNPGEILAIAPLLGNPAKKQKKESPKMATKPAKKRTANRPAAARPAPRKKNSARSKSRGGHRPASRPKSHVKRNAGGGGAGGLVTNALWLIGGAVGTKLLTQSVLGAKNVGIFGYVGNAIAAFGLSLLAAKLLHNQAAAKSILAGGVVQIVLRAIGDYTPFGEFAKSFGMGDYLASNFVTPQRYVDGLNTAEVEIPAGWAPRVVQSNAPPAQLAAGMQGYGNSMYSGKGLYSA